VGRVFHAAFTVICVPGSLAHNGPALGVEIGISAVCVQEGFLFGTEMRLHNNTSIVADKCDKNSLAKYVDRGLTN
jgi:hypothetical protein